jgi:Protein of unknown function (DUF3465)
LINIGVTILKNSKYLIAILLAGLLIAQWLLNEGYLTADATAKQNNPEAIPAAFESSGNIDNPELWQLFQNRQSNVWLTASGEVIKILSDDNKGSRHQRFLVKVNLTQTVLIAHNIDLAERVANLQPGDMIRFRGEYEWNEKGGVIHWTHHDPAGKKAGGWIKHNDIMYQ